MTTASLLSPLERLHLRDQLQDLWRKQVEVLALVDDRTGGTRGAASGGGRAEFAPQRRAARAVLLEVEAAIRRMDGRRYGICEQCAEPISAADLFTVPQRRRCPDCEITTTGAADCGVVGDGSKRA